MSKLSNVKSDNPTRRFVADLLQSGEKKSELHINPAFESLNAVLVDGVSGDVVMEFTADETTLQGGGLVSGGTISSMLDCGMAVAVLSKLQAGQNCATVSLSVNFMSAGVPGVFTVKASVDRIGSRMAYSRAMIYDANEKLIASASTAFAVIGT